jgi:hypothetical protein
MREELYAPITLPDWLWASADTRAALRDRRLGRLFHLAKKYAGASQTRITIATGISQGDVSKMISRDHQVTSIEVLDRVAKGFQMPDQARIDLGVAPERAKVDPAGLRSERRLFGTGPLTVTIHYAGGKAGLCRS